MRKTHNKIPQKLRLLDPYLKSDPLVLTSNKAQLLSPSQHPPEGKRFRWTTYLKNSCEGGNIIKLILQIGK